jgi:FkbM family methyltransferase
MSANPLKARATHLFGVARGAIRLDAERLAVRHRSVYCGDHVVLTRTPTGRKIYLDMRDASIAPGIALGDVYEPEVSAVLARLARPGDTFFDVGANVGYHSLSVYDVVRSSGGEVHMFEPNPTMTRLLLRTFHANAFWAGVSINQLALSDQDGTADMTVYEDWWGGARLQSPEDIASSQHAWARNAAIREQFEVPTTTIDQYCHERGVERIDLLKIDVEGHEEAVVAGMQGIAESSPDLKAVLEFTFGAYADAGTFWESLSAMFSHRYAIGSNGALTRVHTLDDLRAETEIELVNVALAKRSLVE